MKHLLLILALSATLLAPASLTTGCKATPEQVAYKSLKVTWDTVHRAMLAYGELYRAGKVDPQTHAAVVQVHKRYRAAMNLAVDAAQLDWTAPTNVGLSDLAAQLLTLIGTIQK